MVDRLCVSVMQDIAEHLPITEGLERMMTVLKRAGYKTAILSGGFTYFGNYLKQKYAVGYGFDLIAHSGSDGQFVDHFGLDESRVHVEADQAP